MYTVRIATDNVLELANVSSTHSYCAKKDGVPIEVLMEFVLIILVYRMAYVF